MQQRILGPDGPGVGAIGVGTGPMAASEDRPSPEDGAKILVRATELGVTLWDTADAYCLDESEVGYGERVCQIAYAALPADMRDQVVIATKGGSIRPNGAWKQDGRPEHLRGAIEASLKALQTDCIDLYQLHAPDSQVPFADSIGAIAQAQQAGKIRRIGLSNVSAAQIDQAVHIAPIASVQNQMNFYQRAPERDGVLEKCRELGLAFLPYSPLGGADGAKSLDEDGAVGAVASELGVSPQCVVLAWLLGKYDKMIPIPGTRRVATIEDSARAGEIHLTSAQIGQLDAAGV